MKNYFTDSQVKEIALQICEVTNKQTHDGSTIYEFTENRLKALMNLAVEAAIVRVGSVECSDVAEYTTEYWGVLHEPVALGEPLYSVKELEN